MIRQRLYLTKGVRSPPPPYNAASGAKFSGEERVRERPGKQRKNEVKMKKVGRNAKYV